MKFIMQTYLFIWFKHVCMLIIFLFFSNVNADTRYDSDSGYNNCNFYTNGEWFFLKTYVQEPSIIFDVGANVGDWCSMVFRLAPSAKIYAFEPHPKIFKILQQKLPLGSECFNVALSDKIKEIELFVWGSDSNLEFSGLNGLYYRPVLESLLNIPCSQVNVKTTTLDVFCDTHNIQHIDFLKIDTEGSEWDILVGAKNMLSMKLINIIQFEYGGTYIDSKTKLKDVFLLLIEYGYVIYRILPSRLKIIDKWDEELENYQYSNYVAMLN